MRFLLDTHILLWHLSDNPKLALKISAVIENPAHQKFFSIVGLWEIELKRMLGKLEIDAPIEQLLPSEIIILPLEVPHIGYLKNLPFHHRDPFDRMMIAQAAVENLTIITDDGFFPCYEVNILNNE